MSFVNIGKESLDDGLLLGNGTVGTDEAKLSEINFPVNKHIVIRADSGNGSTVKVGRPGQASVGFILNPGEQTPPLYVSSTDLLRVIGGDVDQVYSWVGN